jgi:tetratricopeptide (TPR) repeat protein
LISTYIIKKEANNMRRAAILSLIAIMIIAVACASLDEGDYLQEGYEMMTQGNYIKAEEYFTKVLDINPNNPYALLNLGVVYQNTNRMEQAKAMYNKVIALGATDMPHEVTQATAKGKSLVQIAKDNLSTLE